MVNQSIAGNGQVPVTVKQEWSDDHMLDYKAPNQVMQIQSMGT
jgi:hypothetical protein